MYKVYLIIFKNKKAVYVGCSNNLTRRIHQHNEHSRKQSSKLGRFLNDNNIKLERVNMVVVREFENRKKALKLEKELTISFDKGHMKVLNDNYTKACSRKGKSNNDKFKKLHWILIDFKKDKATSIESLKAYCKNHKLDYRGIHSTSKTVHSHKNRYKLFKEEDWLNLTQPQKVKFLNGSFLDEIKNDILKKHIKRNAKTYIVRYPNGKKETITNLDKFAREHNINSGNLHASISNGRKANGYKAYKLD